MKKPDTGPKKPEVETSYEEWLEIMRTEMPDIERGAIACAAALIQLHLPYIVNPVALALKDAPSSGKTVCLNLFSGLKELCIVNDELTANALMSGSVNNTKGDKDFLRQMKDKCTIVPDLATVFADSDDSVRSHLGKLTRILDGQGYAKADGANGHKSTQEDGDKHLMLVMLMGTTELSNRIWSLMSGLGPRMFFMDLGSKRPDIADIYDFLGDKREFQERQERAGVATEQFIRTCFQRQSVERPTFANNTLRRRIAGLSIFMAYMRSDIRITVDRFNKNEIAHTQPQREHSWRLATGLQNFCMAHAFLRGSDVIEEEDLQIAFWLAFATGSAPRPQMAQEIIELGGVVRCKDLSLERSQAKRELYTWSLLGLGVLQSDSAEKYAELGETPWSAERAQDQRRSEFYDDTITFTFTLDEQLQWMCEKEMQEFYTKYSIFNPK